MGWMDEYNKALKKYKKEPETQKTTTPNSAKNNTSVSAPKGSWMDEYNKALKKHLADDDAPVGKSITSRMTTRSKDDDDEDGLDFFQKGLFDDGWQFGDVAKTILGTAGDAGLNVVKGGASLVEGLVDLVDYGIAGGADLLGYDDYADKLRKATQESLVDKATSGADAWLDQYSVLGKTSDAILQGIGQVGGIMATGGLGAAAGMSSAGVTALTTGTMGLSGMGSGMGEAYQNGATDAEAATYGMISGAADALTEMMFGGLGKSVNALGFAKGLSSADDMLAKAVSSKFKNQIAKNFTEFSIKAGAEGLEEVMAGFLQAAGKKATYMSEEEFKDILEDEKLLEQFVVGAFTSGVIQSGIVPGTKSGSLIEANKNESDFITGTTKNEQTVIDYETAKRIAEKERDGKKLTSKEKKTIEEDVARDLEKGYLSIDSIEEALGGKTYEQYKQVSEWEDSLQQEYDTLHKMKRGDMTGEQIDRENHLRKQIENVLATSGRNQLKTQLSEQVFGLAQGDRLIESYNERDRRGQAFEADLTQYDAKQQAVIQKAVESGVLNNTNRTHELVDMIAKISADKGVLFDFTNNAKLKESGFAIEGKQVNGYVTKDGVTLNVDSPKYLESTVGHEITHVLEGTEFYTELQNTLFEYAKSKGEYDSRLANLTKLYEGVKDADVNAELTADLVGDYLFRDADFINNLSTGNRNVFQKIYDEIKYLCKVVTAGSKEARELERVKKAFEDAYRASAEIESESNTKYSLSDSDGKQLTKEQQDYFKDSKARDENGNLVKVYHSSPTAGFHVFDGSEGHGNYKYGEYGDSITFFTDNKAMADSYSPSNEKVDTVKLNSMDEAQKWLDDIGVADLEVRQNNGRYELYDNDEGGFVVFESEEHLLRDLKRIVQEEYGDIFAGGQYEGYVNMKNPMVVDAEGRPWDRITEEFSQEVYDKFQSLTADEKAALHDLAGWEDASLFVSEIRSAKNSSSQDDYTKNLASAFNKLKDGTGYVNLFNLFDIASDNFTEEAIRESATVMLSTNDYVERALQDGSYDGVIIKNVIDYGGHAHSTLSSPPGNDYIVFNSNQFKAADNLKPTEDADIRYSLSNDKPNLSQIQEMQMEVNRLNESIREFEASEDYKDQMRKITEAVDSGNIAEGVAAYQRWLEESGLGALTDKRNSLRDELDKLRKKYAEASANEALEEERNAIKKSGLNEADYFRKQAVKEFGYTPYFYDAGYIVSNGKMLNFSGEKGKHFGSRGQDHRAIGIIYAETEGTDALNRFVNDGNIRIVPESPGFDVSATIEPTKEQYATIKKFVYEYANKGYFSVDISDKDGRVVGSLQYENRINPTRIISDLKHYYETGEVRQPSTLEGFRYSLSEDTEGRQLSPATAKRFSNSKAVDENGNLLVLYHGTASGEFSIFDKSKGNVEGDFGSGFYFTNDAYDVEENYEDGGPDFDNKVARLAEQIEQEEDIDYEEAEERARAELYKGGHRFEVYLNIENPAVVGKTILFDEEFGDIYNEEDFEDYDEYVAENEQAVADAIENIVWEVDRNVDVYSTDGLAEVLFEAFYEGGVGIEGLKDRINQLYLEDNNGNFVGSEVTRQIIESLGYDGIIDPTVSTKFNMGLKDSTTHYIVFKPNQIKAVTNQNPTDNPDIHRSLSNVGEEAPLKSSYGATLGRDVRLETAEESTDVAPVSKMETTTPTVSEMEIVEFPDDGDVVHGELERLTQQKTSLEERLFAMSDAGEFGEEFNQLSEEWGEVSARIADLENSISESESGRIDSLTDADMPPETDAPYYGESDPDTVSNPFENRDWYEVGTNRSARAFMVENPEFQPFFQSEAMAMLGELGDSQKAERWYNDQLHYESGGEKGFGGQKRFTSQDIARLLDEWHLSYAQIEEGLTAIVENNSKVNNAPAKRIEFMLNDRLLNGYKDFHTGQMVPPNQEYQNMIREWQVNQQAMTTFDSFMPMADQYAPAEEVAPVKPLAKATPDTVDAPVFESKEPGAVKGQTTLFEPEKPKVNPKVARVLTEESAKTNKKSGIASKVVGQLVDKGMVFENLSLKTGNHELQAKYNYALPSNTEARAQYLMENGDVDTKSLKQIIKEVKKTGKTEKFFDYLYHVHNIDRMSLEDRFDVPNKAVFGETVTADVSRQKVFQYEKANPEFKGMAEDVYAYNKHLRKMLVKGNVISQETADLWEKMYPHYVPVRRVDQEGLNISVPLDSRKTGVNNPVKRATGGSSDIEPLFETMAMRTEQTYRAIARNDFGIELMNTLGSEAVRQKPSVDEMIDTIGAQEDLLKPGTVNSNPTFAVFENGEKVEFEITEDMFDALKPAGKLLGYRNKAIHKVGNWRRNLLTSWNPIFAWYRNPIKDLQDVAINSQHPVKTYLNIPNAIIQMAADGKYATEYHKNGGKSNTYFDSRTNQFKAEDNIFKKTIGMPIRAIEKAGEIIEEIPRLAEYIASRQAGRSVERSMLDAARVTTNFAAGGDFTKFLNSHGFTFLNASVQGASQHIRNIREAKQQGLKGYVKVLAKYTVAGLPGVLLNSLLWDDDEDYEELNDYVKQNYYVIAKTEDGKFVRIPKGRTAAVVQECMEQMQNLVTGDDEADFGTFFELFMNNIAPNNPIENNILAPIGQVMSNKAWYGDDLVPSRLQKLPAEEQFDESTDSISKWLGEKTGTSPYKWNYLIDQYSGGLGDVFLPMKTPEAESGDNSLLGNILAPWKKEITTDKVLNNKNPGDFYDLKDELEVMSNSKNATDEDKMRSLYMDTVGWEMSDLYAQKREIQNSDLPDDEKYEAVREVQEQINALANNALDGYNDVHINGLYSEVGGKRFNHDAESGKWYEIKPKNADGSDNYYYQQEQKVTKGLGISYGEYWNNREEYNFAYDKPGQYAVAKSVGGYDAYMEYYDVLQNWQSDNYIAADKDSKGNSISGSRKEKVIDYINGLDADYGTKIILFRTVYSSKADKRAYNQDIVDYLNSRDDISYQEMKTILEELDFKVDSEGNVTW